MKGMDLPDPEFVQEEVEGSLVKVTLRNNIRMRKMWVDTNVTDVIGTAIAKTLTEEQRICINFIAENGEISVSQAQRMTGRSWPAAKNILVSLVEKGILYTDKRQGMDRDPKGRYYLSK